MDTIVIGGGIAGLLTALRLANAGQEAIIVESGKLGSGATSANHGMLHSGALYVRQHGHIVAACQEAQAAFATLLRDDDPITSDEVVYVVHESEDNPFRAGLDDYTIPHVVLEADAVAELPTDIASSHTLIGVRERVISSRRLVDALARQCVAAGVAILPGTTVDRITRKDDRVSGIVVGIDEHLTAQQVVLAAGIGTPSLLEGVGSRHCAQLKSRLDMMLHFPRSSLNRGVVFAAIDRPVAMPALGGGALVSFFGGAQPQIAGPRGFAVDLDKATLLVEETMRAIAPGVVDPAGATAYVAGKTDYIGSPYTQNAVVNPGFHVIDHADEALAGLYSVITGKMTLAFHASLAVARAVLDTDDIGLSIAPISTNTISSPDLARLAPVAVEPWAVPGAI